LSARSALPRRSRDLGGKVGLVLLDSLAERKSDETGELDRTADLALSFFQRLRHRLGGIVHVDLLEQANLLVEGLEAGIDESRVLQFSEGTGGRYSLWSAVGVSAALALGWDAFEELLEGAAEMDRHFRYSEPPANVPLIAAFADLLYTQKLRCQTRGVFPYDERLRLLVPYLQQLVMESNGKSVTSDGKTIDRPTAPVLWGGVGTDAQHAVFQLLHQGPALIPVEFLAVAEDVTPLPEHHRLLLLNAFAQGAALMRGGSSDDPNRNYPGNRPSSTILLERLDARTLGALLAFYEHRTFAAAVLMGINPFDQFGVALGKRIARELAQGEGGDDLDASTRALMERAGLDG